MSNLAIAFERSAEAVAELGNSSGDIAALSEEQLLAALQKTSAHRRHLDTYAAWVAAAIAHRSRRELGYAGLAQRRGFITAETLIQSMSQGTRAEAVKLVQLGTILAETEAAAALAKIVTPDIGSSPGKESASSPSPQPWQAPLAAAVSEGELSMDAAEAVRRGLGEVDQAVTTSQWTAAAEELVVQAGTLTVDQLYRQARSIRNDLDAAGIARHEKEQRDNRYLKLWRQPDGMFRLSGLLDPENGMILSSAIDTVLSPRRGGPRFIDPTEKARADILLADRRSNEQIAADALIDMVRLAIEADPGTLFGSRRPAVRVLVIDRHLARDDNTRDDNGERSGHGHLEGHPSPISIDTIHRHLCDRGTVGVKFDDDGQCINVGRDQRLFTARQRIGLAVRDGGCRFPGCDRPPAWCEAHHIDEWHRAGGVTDLRDGILLCRHHHMLIHNNGWRIIREKHTKARPGGEQPDQPAVIYWLKPPKQEDPAQRLRPMPSRSAPLRALHHHGHVSTQHAIARK